MNTSFKPMAGKVWRRLAGAIEVPRQMNGLQDQLYYLDLQSKELARRMASPAPCKATQILLGLRYQELAGQDQKLPRWDEVEFRAFSQNGEDGLLWYLFSLVGTTNKRALEMCAGTGIECNAANLIVNHDWRGLLLDGNPANIAAGMDFYSHCADTYLAPPQLVETWITAENVNDLVRRHGYEGDIDLLSLDMDGIDYWVWKALDAVWPRVVVAEFNTCWGADRAVTIPYDPNFKWDIEKNSRYWGASLAAFVKLGKSKGYRLIGVQQRGFNAFFMRNGIGEQWFPEVSPTDIFDRLPRLKDLLIDPGPGPHGRPWVWVDV